MGLAIVLIGIAQMIGAAAVFAWSAAASTLSLLTSTLGMVFSLNGLKILTSCVLIWLVAAVWSASHANVYEVVDDVWCEAEPLRIWFTNLIDFFAQQSEGLICFYNLIVHWTSIITFEFFVIALECPDPVIFAAGELFEMVGSTLNQFIQVLYGPLSYTFDMTQIWLHWTAAVGWVEEYWKCFCYDLSPLFEFVRDVVTAPSISCTIESAVNVVLAVIRLPANIFFSNFPSLTLEWPDFTDTFAELCDLVGCLGDVFDEWLMILVELRSGMPADNPAIGCTIGRFICVLLRILELFINFFLLVLQLVTGVTDLAQFIDSGLNFNLLINSITELADCVYLLFANFNVCAGDAARNLLLLVVRTIELLLAIIRDPVGIDTAVANWKATLDDVVGDTQLGDLGEEIFPNIFHDNRPIGVTSGLHSMQWFCDMNNDGVVNAFAITVNSVFYTGSDTSYPCYPGYTDNSCELGSSGYRAHCILQGSRKQTGLTCFVASVLGNGICSRAVADLLSSVVQLLLTALDFALQLYQGISAPGNTGVCGPFGTTTDRDDTIIFIGSLFNLIVSRVLSIVDYLGHVLECLPLFSPFGHIISVVVYAIYDVITDLTRLLAIIVAFIVEGIIMIIELVSLTKLFTGCTQYQIVFWIRIFFENLLTEVFRIISQFINILLFNWFPGVINFGQPDYSDGGHPGFTECIFNFGDCICVLVESIIQSVFSAGPFCGTVVWTTLRKRDANSFGQDYEMFDAQQARADYRNHSVFEFVDRLTNNKFPRDTECGFVMHEYNPYRNKNLTEYQQHKYYECMKLFVAGFQLSQQVPGVPLDFFFDKAKVHNTTVNLIRSVPYMFYYWMTQSNQTTEEFIPHIDDPVTHLVWNNAMKGKREMAERLRANSPAAPSNPVYEHFEMGSEAIRLAMLIPFKIFNSLSQRNFTGAASDAITHVSELAKRNVFSTLEPPNTVFDPNLVYQHLNATASLQVQQMTLGIQAYADIFRYGGDYVLQAHSPVLRNISDLLNLLLSGRLNQTYTAPPLIPGFQCRGFDGILRRLFNKTLECISRFNVTSALNITVLGTWGSLSVDPSMDTMFQPSFQPQVFSANAVTPSGKSDWLTTVIYDVAQFLNERLIGSLLGDVRQWPVKLLNIFANTAVDSTPSSGGHGIWWYLVFPFYCSADKLNCSNGLGLVEGVKWTLLYVTILVLFIGFVLPPGISTLAVMALTTGIPIIFLGVTFGYAPTCFPRIPECSLTEVADLFKAVNVTCVPWPAGVVTGACTSGCADRTIADCRTEVGIVDGFDELVILLEWSFPTEMQMFRDSFLFGYVERITWLRQTLEQNILNGSSPTPLQQFCFYTQILLFVQVITLLTVGGGVAGVSVLAVVSLLTAAYTFVSSFFTVMSSFVIAWKFGNLDDRIEEVHMQSMIYSQGGSHSLRVGEQADPDRRTPIVRRKQQ